MSIGTLFASEATDGVDPATGRRLRRLTRSPYGSYPLYYFVPSITSEGDRLVFYSERSGWVQIYSMDLDSGRFAQISEGSTRDSGWAIWSEYHLRGVYNHLAALNGPKREVFYFDHDEIRATHLDTVENRCVHRMPGRMPIGQSAFSPDGSLFAFIHADERMIRQRLADREALRNMRFPVDGDEHLNAWRNTVPCTISLLDTASGDCRIVLEMDYHVHHVLFLGSDRLLINHPRNDLGMWTVRLDGSGFRHLRPRDQHGAVCHQIVTPDAIFYETYSTPERRTTTFFGRYDLATDTFREFPLPGYGYGHTGSDPAGTFAFYEFTGQASAHTPGHAIYTIRRPFSEQPEFEKLRELPPAPGGQREHAHPFLSPCRRWMYFTEVTDGVPQICALDVADLVEEADAATAMERQYA